MKKLLASAIIILISYSSFAQKNDEVFQKGTNVINAGIGVGDVYWGTGYSHSGLPISLNASFEHGITDKLGIGYIAVGGQIAYSSSTYKVSSYKWTNSGVLVAARASYHFALDGDIGEKLDPYAGVLFGYVITSSSNDAPSGYNYSYSKASAVAGGAFAGAHYYFTPNFGAFAEVGYNITSVLNTGLTFKF